MTRPTVIAGRMTRGEAIDRLAAELERRTVRGPRESAADVAAFARAEATRLVDEAIAGARGGVAGGVIGAKDAPS